MVRKNQSQHGKSSRAPRHLSRLRPVVHKRRQRPQSWMLLTKGNQVVMNLVRPFLNYFFTQNKNILTDEEAFEMTYEIHDKARGARKGLTLPSTTSWDELQDKASQILNIHPASLQLQYCFSNEKNNSLPFNLDSHDDYVGMCGQLRPFVVPRILSNGKPSKSVRKLVVVQLFNKSMEQVSDDKVVKVSAFKFTAVTSNLSYIIDKEIYQTTEWCWCFYKQARWTLWEEKRNYWSAY